MESFIHSFIQFMFTECLSSAYIVLGAGGTEGSKNETGEKVFALAFLCKEIYSRCVHSRQDNFR